MTVRVCVAEDEDQARRHIEALTAATPWLTLVGSAADGRDAVELIEAQRPDAVFVDVRMPRLSGVEVLRRLSYQPRAVFTTAFDEYAITAFELGAIDYLLKPFGEERFRRAAARLRQPRVPSPGASIPERLDAVSQGLPRRIFARQREHLVPIDLAQVQRLSASRDYTELHLGGADYLLRLAISEIEPQLDPARFVRIHRSHIVNLEFVERIELENQRRMSVVLRNGDLVPVSRTGARRIRALTY